jgi:hypothetical protein
LSCGAGSNFSAMSGLHGEITRAQSGRSRQKTHNARKRAQSWSPVFYGALINIAQTGAATSVRLGDSDEIAPSSPRPTCGAPETKFRPQPVWNFQFGPTAGPIRQAGGLCVQGPIADGGSIRRSACHCRHQSPSRGTETKSPERHRAFRRFLSGFCDFSAVSTAVPLRRPAIAAWPGPCPQCIRGSISPLDLPAEASA